MKRQYLRLFSFLIGLTFIISGILYTFVNDYKRYKKKQLEEEIKISEEITDVYKTFYDKVKELSELRDEYNDDMSEFSIYFQTMPEHYDDIVEKLDKYEETISEIDESSEYLKKVCNKRYSVADANDKCSAYYINLEKSINLFVGDLEFFNSKIKEYNEWIVEENKSVIVYTKYKELDEYNAKEYTKYVDLNNDDTYLGRNSG